ncbi:hydroxylase [Nocardioides sp. GY 10113]|uniref:ferritin-like fold-containing protein n=1 Tax=Nocardioides sp. GY 10113 TaxID=2569761 RepID=UPI0010A75455|nr:ferritin-like fold-containing protein [Nocardioides sp. GY 10113]TIC87370.1 hydroxylase [Nocardioides sp. GY 10113]
MPETADLPAAAAGAEEPEPSTGAGPEATVEESSALADPAYRQAVVDLLAVIAYGEITAFERLVEDARLAPTLPDTVELATMACVEFDRVHGLHARIRELGGDPFAAMEPFTESIQEFHAHTAPADWYEGLVKAYVGDGLASDFHREIAAYLDPTTRDLVVATMEGTHHSRFVVDRVRAGIAEDPRLGGRLALWGRRLMGEALIQAQRVAADRDALTALLTGGVDRPSLDLVALGRMFTRLTERHADRMGELGLEA